MAKCLECTHWKPCFNGKEWDAAIGTPCKYFAPDIIVGGKWIPVTERLPDLELVEAMSNDTDFYPCLAVIKHERLMGRRYISKLWYDKNGFIDGDCIDRTSNVTHWMPLPELPMRKGEDDG